MTTSIAPHEQEQDDASPEELREQAGAEFMGPGFDRGLSDAPWKRRAYQFWYHPFTDLAIFALILISVGLLLFEIASPTERAVGWMGGLATGTAEGWVFWVDGGITLFFVIEYASKLWIAPSGRKLFFVRNSWIELLALLPVLRVFRLFRIFRITRIFRVFRVFRSLRLVRSSTGINKIFNRFGAEASESRTLNIIVFTYFVLAMVFGTTGIMVFERDAGSGFDTLGDALWWCVVTISTVGYGDIVPETPGGRIVASGVVLAGLGFWSLVTGVFASALIRRSRRRKTMGLDILGIRGHVVIMGWNENGRRLIADLRPRNPTRHLVIVTEEEHLRIRPDARLHHLRGDPTEYEVLIEAQVDRARAAVVLADAGPSSVDADGDIDADADIDARTIMTCMALRRSSEELRIIAELRDAANYDQARRAGADETIVTHNYTGALLSQSVQSPGVNRAYSELFDIGGGSVFAEISFPDESIGSAFAEAAEHLYESRGLALIGLRRGSKLRVAPGDGPSIKPGDQAVVIQPLDEDKRK